jgi:hypothetical protein
VTTQKVISNVTLGDTIIDLPVHRFIVPLGCHNFRGKVIRRATQRPCDVRHFFCKAKIGYLQVAMSIKEKILRFEITVDNVHGVEVIESKGYFGRIKLCDRIREAL